MTTTIDTPSPAPAAARSAEVPEYEPTSTAHQIGTLIAVIVPFVSVFFAIWMLWATDWVGWTDIGLLVGLHLIAAVGVTVGLHRLFTHRSFETGKTLRLMLAVAGEFALEGRLINWVSDHRRHHSFSDQDGDPHSPHVGRKPGFWGATKGLYHAHVGWLFTSEQSSGKRYAPDLLKESMIVKVNNNFHWIALSVLVIPFVLGFAISGTLIGGLTGLFWGGIIRIFITHHITWSVNSICHMFGRRPFESGDLSTNNWVLALPTMGEAWHHNHHTFPTSAFHGLKRWQRAMDPSAWIILTLEKLGLVWNVKRVTPEQIAAKLKGATEQSEPQAV